VGRASSGWRAGSSGRSRESVLHSRSLFCVRPRWRVPVDSFALGALAAPSWPRPGNRNATHEPTDGR
jgi:hypothetical protein